MDVSSRITPYQFEGAREFSGALGLGPFRLVRRLGDGGHGDVWLATRVSDGERVALKCARPDVPRSSERIRAEYEALGSLAHPALPAVKECGLAGPPGLPWFAMELIDGKALSSAFEEAPVRSRLELFMQALELLEFMHGGGWIHGDLKPENLLLEERAARLRLRVIDLGFAESQGQAANPWVRATLEFAAPEVLDGERPTPSSDLYSLGRTFLELYGPAGPEGALLGVLKRMCESDRDSRHASATEVLKELSATLEQHGVHRSANRVTTPQFVGREVELQSLRERLQALAAQEPAHSRVCVFGPSGSGKTRLLQEALRGVEFAGIRPLWVRSCTRGGFEAALKSAAGLEPSEEVRACWPDEPGAWEGSWFDWLGKALNCGDLAGPMVFVLDDVDSSCGEVGALLETLDSELPVSAAWLVIVAVDSTHASILRRPAKLHPRDLQLPRLRVDQLQRVSLGAQTSPALRGVNESRIARGADGLAAIVMHEDVLQASPDMDAQALDRCLDRAAPAWILEHARKVVAELNAPELALAQAAATLDTKLERDVLLRIVGESEGGGVLEALVASEVLTFVEDSTSPGYRFRFDAVRRRVLAGLSGREQEELHGLVAHVLDAQGEREPARLARAAFHWHAAGNHEKSATAAEGAVHGHLARNEAAAAMAAWSQLAKHRARMSDSELLKLRELHGDVLLMSVRAQEARDIFEGLLREESDLEREARFLRKSAAALHTVGQSALARDRLLHARERLQASRAWEDRAKTCEDLAPVLCALGEWEQAREFLLEGLEYARRSASWKLHADILNDLGLVAYLTFDYVRALDHHGEALRIRERESDRDGIARSKVNLANVEFMAGSLDRSAELQREAAALKAELGDSAGAAQARLNLAEVELLLGRHGEALQTLEHYRGSPVIRQEPRMRIALLEQLAEFWIHKAEYGRASECLAEARELASSIELSAEKRGELARITAAFHIRVGERGEATRWLREGLELATDSEAINLAGRLLSLALNTGLHAPEHVEQAFGLVEGWNQHEAPAVRRTVCIELLLALSALTDLPGSADRAGGCSGDAQGFALAEEALRLASEAGTLQLEAEARLRVIRFLDPQHDGGRLSTLAHQVLEFANRQGLRELGWRSRRELARLHAVGGRIPRAIHWYRQSLEGIRECLERLHCESARESYLEMPEAARVLAEFRHWLPRDEEGRDS